MKSALNKLFYLTSHRSVLYPAIRPRTRSCQQVNEWKITWIFSTYPQFTSAHSVFIREFRILGAVFLSKSQSASFPHLKTEIEFLSDDLSVGGKEHFKRTVTKSKHHVRPGKKRFLFKQPNAWDLMMKPVRDVSLHVSVNKITDRLNRYHQWWNCWTYPLYISFLAFLCVVIEVCFSSYQMAAAWSFDWPPVDRTAGWKYGSLSSVKEQVGRRPLLLQLRADEREAETKSATWLL